MAVVGDAGAAIASCANCAAVVVVGAASVVCRVVVVAAAVVIAAEGAEVAWTLASPAGVSVEQAAVRTRRAHNSAKKAFFIKYPPDFFNELGGYAPKRGHKSPS